MKGDVQGEGRAAFLGSSYGTARERFRLSPQPGPAPSWARGNWAVVTAWNPQARHAPAGVNAQAGAALLARVRASGLSPLPAHNGEGEWREEALIVPAAHLRQAAAWGGAFGQVAVLWATGSRVALVWLDGAGHIKHLERFWARLIEQL